MMGGQQYATVVSGTRRPCVQNVNGGSGARIENGEPDRAKNRLSRG